MHFDDVASRPQTYIDAVPPIHIVPYHEATDKLGGKWRNVYKMS